MLPILTIIIPLYNQERHIAQCFDSIFMQKTSYKYKIIVADDCSSDNSLKIVKSYQQRYPNIIEILNSNINQKLYKNIVRVYKNLKTEYFCVLDPDDFWIDNNLIQEALNFLQSHKNFTSYCANTLLRYSHKDEKYINDTSKRECSFVDFINPNGKKVIFGHTSATFFRNIIFKNKLPIKMEYLENATNVQSFRGDSFRNIIHLHEGKAFFYPKISSVYRVNGEGIWTSLNKVERLIINANFYKDMWFYYDKKYPEFLCRFYYGLKEILNQESIILDIIYALYDNQLNEKMKNMLKQLNELYTLYETHKEIIEKNIKLKRKYIFFLNIYYKLRRKLLKKNLINSIDMELIFKQIFIEHKR